MNLTTYLNQFTWIIPILFGDILTSIVLIYSKNVDANLFHSWKFLSLLILLNAFIAYVIGGAVFLNVEIQQTIQVPKLVSICMSSFLILLLVEFIYIKGVNKRNELKRVKEKETVSISMSPEEYKDLIINAEKDAKEICIIPKRITVMFKSDEMVKSLAMDRFGDSGSLYYDSYVYEHRMRKQSFLTLMQQNGKIYELQNEDELIEYVQKQSHIGIDTIDRAHFIEMINNWKKALSEYKNKYYVRLTKEKVPFKYEIIDKTKLIIHESVGSSSRERLNAIMIDSEAVVSEIHKDFTNLWEKVHKGKSKNEDVIKFIDEKLLPILTNEI